MTKEGRQKSQVRGEVFTLVMLVSRFQNGVSCGCWFQGLVWTAFPLDRPSPDRPSPGPPKVSLFFFPFPPPFRSFCVSLGVFSWNFGGILEGRNPKVCTFGLPGCRVKPRRPLGPPPSGPTLRAPTLRCPTLRPPPTLRAPTFFWVWAPTLRALHPVFSGFGPLAFISEPNN